MGFEPLRITGLTEFRTALREMDADLAKQMRVALNESANLVKNRAVERTPKRSGRAAASLRAASTQQYARIRGGGSKAPYFGWLDYGGTVGRPPKTAHTFRPGARNTGVNRRARLGSVRRPFVKEGRIMYPAFLDERAKIQAVLLESLARLAEKNGVGVARGGR